MIHANRTNANEPSHDAPLPDCRTLFRSDAKLRRELDAFAGLCAAARAAGRDPEKLSNGLLHALVFEARNAAGSVGKASLCALGRKGRVRRDLSNEDVRACVASLLSFAAKGGELTEREFAAREAEFSAAVGGPAPEVFRRLVAAAFPAKAVAVPSDADFAALLRGLAAAGRAEPLPAGATWLARCRAVHDAIRAEWAWPDAAARSALARRLAAEAVAADRAAAEKAAKAAEEAALFAEETSAAAE